LSEENLKPGLYIIGGRKVVVKWEIWNNRL
jgi:hypothetical protein